MQSHHPSPLRALRILSPVLLLFTGCGVTAERNVRVFNACLTRHAQDSVICEAPLQAYDVGLPALAARSLPEVGLGQ